MKRILTSALALAITLPIAVSAESGTVFQTGADLSKMNARELSEFYKKNPDYGKNRISLDYSKYAEGDWVVFRGELYGSDGNPVQGAKATMEVSGLGGDPLLAVSNQKGVFNMEIPKSSLEDAGEYSVSLRVGGIVAESGNVSGKELKEKSVYHFRLTGGPGGPKLESVHNPVLREPEEDVKVLRAPSAVGIQSWPLFAVILLLIAYGGLSWHKSRKEG